MKLAPKTATVVRNGKEETVSVDQVRKGDVFVVKPGENIPVDGIVLEGSSAVNESALTGESIPVDKNTGDSVSAATLNQSGYLRCEATRVGEDTTLSQIIQMVSDAAATKAPIAKVADRVSECLCRSNCHCRSDDRCMADCRTDSRFCFGKRNFGTRDKLSVCTGTGNTVAIMVGNGMGAKNGIMFKTAFLWRRQERPRLLPLIRPVRSQAVSRR